MTYTLFQNSFTPEGLTWLKKAIVLALNEDGPDLTAQGIFTPQQSIKAYIRAKEDSLVTGLPLIPLIHTLYEQEAHKIHDNMVSKPSFSWQALVDEGSFVTAGTDIASLCGSVIDLLKLERVILNFLCHLSGISNTVRLYVQALEGTNVRLLDTRKTHPALRWPEKYAVLVGGGHNHRRNLTEMLMLKDNHIDAAGSISQAVQALRTRYSPCPPIEVECRKREEVIEAVAAKADRIMLDNMDVSALAENLPYIPLHIEAEISGGVCLENIRALALAAGTTRRADFISVGRLTHSAKAADFSMRMTSC